MSLKIVKKSFNDLTSEELYRIFDLRFKVFVIEQKIFYLDTDFKDQNSIHYMMYDQEHLVSYLRMVLPGYKYKEHALSRIATDVDYRSQGLATKLIQKAMHDVKGQPIRISGQAYLKAYYEGLGFKVVRDLYIEEDIPHYEMYHENK